VNPEPLADFIDVFFIGEAEEAVHEIIELKQEHPRRQQFLEALAKRDGFYVPAVGASTVRRRYLTSIDSAPYPDRPILPLMKPVHDRVTVEVARGCIRGCRFCQAGIIYRPFRERSPERVKNILQESLACTGYEELSLASLSSGDYSAIQLLVIELMEKYRDSRISVSLPSLRVGTLTPEMIEAIAGTRKTGFTLAPEAGTERLRRVINKPVSDQDLMDAAETIFKNGWNVLKLYFMIGLPTETDEDLDGIIRLGHELLARGKRTSKRHVQINVSVSTFVPKPHTPFQWMGQEPLEEIRRKQTYLEKGLRRRGISLKPHHPETSILEAAFARGDRSLGRVIEEAIANGCRFDGWSESFDFAKWTDAFKKCGLDPASYACRTFGLDDELPWDHVRSGVTKEFLKREYQRAAAAEITENCRVECERCGIGCKDGGTPSLGKSVAAVETEHKQPVPHQVHKKHPDAREITARIRMKYTKTGRMRFLSHLDLMTLFHRAASRAGIAISFSQGFNPHPKISFGPALPVGMESEAEFLDMETDPLIDLLKITRDLNNTLPEGIKIVDSRIMPQKSPSLSGSISRYVYEVNVPATRVVDIKERVKSFLSLSSLIVTREDRQKDIRPCIEAIVVEGPDDSGALLITLQDVDQIKPRVQDVIQQLLDIGAEQSVLLPVRRTAVYCKNRGLWMSPMDR
jgi:radical SAM-linked protein